MGLLKKTTPATKSASEMQGVHPHYKLLQSIQKAGEYSLEVQAKLLVAERVYEIYGDLVELEADDVYVVWFSKTLKNWKALVSTTIDDNRYYEVTYNGDSCVAYVDVYVKESDRAIRRQDWGF